MSKQKKQLNAQRQKLAMERALVRLQEGDIYTPLFKRGERVDNRLSKRMESLRLVMLELKDKEAEYVKRTNTAIAAVAHDMKTPLAIVAGYAECMSDGMEDKDYPQLILQKTAQMNDMVVDLVDNSHQELIKQATRRSLYNARELLGAIVHKLQPVAEKKEIHLQSSSIPNVHIRVDASQMERVMQNLLTNACKYSAAGSTVKIKLNVWGKRLVIRVKDQGMGIAKDNLPYVFDQFYTENKARSTAESQGMGLYVVKDIVQNHGGEVMARSKKGKGSTFIVMLPVEPSVDDVLTITGRFDRLPVVARLLWTVFFGWGMCSVYRLIRFGETRCPSTLVAGIAALPLFMFFWMIDVTSIIVYRALTFLTE